MSSRSSSKKQKTEDAPPKTTIAPQSSSSSPSPSPSSQYQPFLNLATSKYNEIIKLTNATADAALINALTSSHQTLSSPSSQSSLSTSTSSRALTFPYISLPSPSPLHNDIYSLTSLHMAYHMCVLREDVGAVNRCIDLSVLRGGSEYGVIGECLGRSDRSGVGGVGGVGGAGGAGGDASNHNTPSSSSSTLPLPSPLPSPLPLPSQYIIKSPKAHPIPRIDSQSLTPSSFLSNNFTHKPAIITNSLKAWPASSRWSNLSYLKHAAGDRLIPVETYDASDDKQTYLTDSWCTEVMSLRDYIEMFMVDGEGDREGDNKGDNKGDNQGDNQGDSGSKNDRNRMGYLSQHQLFDQIPSLKDDIVTPEYLVLNDVDKAAPDTCEVVSPASPIVSAWFGPKGTVSPLHNDPYHNLLCQVVGRKYVRVYCVEETNKLYPRDDNMCNNSHVNIDEADNIKYPKFNDANFYQCVLEEGDMLYIPRLSWHYVRSLSTSFSVSYWWGAKMGLVKDANDDDKYHEVY
jgi:hypothetical protein